MSAASACREFRGKRVLVFEDDALMSFTLYRAIERLGAEVVGPVAFLDDALMLAEGPRVDAAILDRRLCPEERLALARELARLRVPFVEACGDPSCSSAGVTCHRLSEATSDLSRLGRALFAFQARERRKSRRAPSSFKCRPGLLEEGALRR